MRASATHSPRPARGVRRRGSALRDERGFTIIELMVAGLIIVIITGATIWGLGSLRRASLSAEAGRLDSAFRYIHHRAALTGLPHRLVVDMDAGKYWVEELDKESGACSSFAVRDVRKKDLRSIMDRSKAEKRKKFGRGGKKAARGSGDDGEPKCPEEERDADGQCPKSGFATVDNRLAKPRELPKGIRFTGVMTTHQQELQPEGKGYIYVFPNGFMEKAHVYIASDQATFTVETFPLLGKVKVHNQELDIRRILRED